MERYGYSCETVRVRVCTWDIDGYSIIITIIYMDGVFFRRVIFFILYVVCQSTS